MKIGIIGVGSMACLFAARLSSVCDVVLIGNWQQQIKALQKNLKVIGLDGKENNYKIKIFNDASLARPVDIVIILVKAYQTSQATLQAKKILSGSNVNFAVTLQNGVGNWEKLCSELGQENCGVGVTTQAAKIIEPGIVMNSGDGSIWLSNFASSQPKTHILKNILNECGWQVFLSQDIQSILWSKLAVNAGINPLTSILNQKNGYIGQNNITNKLMCKLAKEAVNVAQAQGIHIPFADNIEKHMLSISESTANNTSSMLQDILRGAATEIEAICGEIINKGKEYKVATPINIIMYDLVKKLESNTIKPDCNYDVSWILE